MSKKKTQKNSKSKKGHNSEKKKKIDLSPLIVWIFLSILNTYSEFQVNIFCNNRDITKCQSFFTTTQTTPRLYSNTSGFLRKQPSKKRDGGKEKKNSFLPFLYNFAKQL